MISTIVLTLSLSLCVCAVVYLVLKNQQKTASSKRDKSLAELEEVLRTAQLTNSGFFQSLELVQKNLESLLARAESAEQRMRNLMLQPGMEKREQYTAAALLLGDGQEPSRVASMLNLPLPQFEIVHELQRIGSKEKKANLRAKRSQTNDERAGPLPTKIAARREKSSQPILLVDVIKRAANDSAVQSGVHSPFGGANA